MSVFIVGLKHSERKNHEKIMKNEEKKKKKKKRKGKHIHSVLDILVKMLELWLECRA